MLRACSQSCARTTRHPPFHKQGKARREEERREEERREGKKKRVVLDGGGARLADAATRHHLTQTPTQRRKAKRRKSGEQNKHTRTQTIQKTSTRPSTSHGHHTLPSMRNQTPIPQQRTTQTQLRRSRPHNPSITRRNQPPRQRASVMRQMQQQTRQRTRRQRKSTPLPEKRRRTRQTTHRSHANTMLRHMVGTHRYSAITRKTGGEGRENSKRQRNTMVFGDNVRARRAARALPRTPTTEEKEKEENVEDKRRELHTHRHSNPHINPTAIPQ